MASKTPAVGSAEMGEAIGRIALLVAGILALIVLGVITVLYQVQIVLPQKMAAQNYCWRELPTSQEHAYQPCESAGGAK